MREPLRHEPPGGTGSPDRPQPGDETGQVVQLRPRPRPAAQHGGGAARPASPPARPAVEDIGKYERPGEDDDYRHRMIMNVIGFLACAFLIVGGIWIATAIADLRNKQDCVLSGRRNCAQLEMPSRLRW
jgi:hypothetical protein